MSKEATEGAEDREEPSLSSSSWASGLVPSDGFIEDVAEETSRDAVERVWRRSDKAVTTFAVSFEMRDVLMVAQSSNGKRFHNM